MTRTHLTRCGLAAIVAISAALVACTTTNHGAAPPASTTGASTEGCPLDGSDLPGYVLTIDKTRFAFGGTPSEEDDPGYTRWIGPDGVWAVSAGGYALASMNAGAAESNAAGWSSDADAVKQHVVAYFTGSGLSNCQIAFTGVEGGGGGGGGSTGGGGTTSFVSPFGVSLSRAIDGITVVESNAFAEFTKDDVTIHENVYWPSIPGAVVADARSWRDELATPDGLAAYLAKLPAGVATGAVAIHHSAGRLEPVSFTARASFDVAPVGSEGEEQSFDRDGKPVPFFL